jgi:cytochrome c-type biogenesis protein CcmF
LRAAFSRLAPAIVVGLAAAGVASLLGVRNGLALGAIGLAGIALFSALMEGILAFRASLTNGKKGASQPSRRLGASLAHAGLAILLFGLSGEAGKVEGDLSLSRGAQESFEQATFRLEEVDFRTELDREVLEASVIVERPGGRPRRLRPARHRYRTHAEQPTSEAAWLTDLAGDLFLTLGHVDPDGQRAGLRVIQTPLILWIWIGSSLIALGGLLAVAFLLRPTARAAVAVTSTTIGFAMLFWLASPSVAFLALAALGLGLAMIWLGKALVLPLWGLEPDKGPRRLGSCPDCGAALVTESLFCHKCGAKVARDA